MTSYQVAEWLRKGVAAAQAGDVERACELLLKVVDVDEYNEQAWLWLSSVVESDADREVCLENVLAINPDNALAAAGLVHLRSPSAQPPPPPPAPEPEQEPQPGPTPVFPFKTATTDAGETYWWDQPQADAPPTTRQQSVAEQEISSSAPADDQTQADSAWAPPETRPAQRRIRVSVQRMAIVAFLLLGFLAASVAAIAVLRLGIFDPTKRDYARAMRPLLAEYDAWWKGPQGTLVNDLDGFCGPGADGWRNRDVLLACSSMPAVDCAALVGHCGADVEAMREQVDKLAREAQNTGQALLSEFGAITPPSDITLSHARFLACLQTRVAQAGRIRGLARGEPVSDPDYLPTCQMFSSAEEEVRVYVDGP